MNELKRLYQDVIRQHAAKPVGLDLEIAATHRHEEYNAQCGDRVEMMLRITDHNITEAAFAGEACAICLASASLFCQHMPGLKLEDLNDNHRALSSALSDSEVELDGWFAPLLGVRPFPSRIQCVLLPWKAAQKALGKTTG